MAIPKAVKRKMKFTKQTVLNDVLEAFFAKRNEIQLVYLFGSVARKDDRPNSDIDIAVLLSNDSRDCNHLRLRIELENALRDLLHRDDIDVVILNSAPPLLNFQVVKYGEAVFDRSGTLQYDFKVRAINDYLDVKPMLDFHWRNVRARILGVNKQ